MSGHVFIVHGDLTQLACDAWLLPCDMRAQPGRRWLAALGARVGTPRWPRHTVEWRAGQQRAMRVDAWPDDLPRPWLVNVGAPSTTGAGWYVGGAVEFLERAVDDLAKSGRPPRHDRAKRLLALPVVGTGHGGARRRAGEIVRELIPVLRRQAERLDVDIALVTNEALTFAAAEAQRGAARSAWPELDDTLWAESGRLAAMARGGGLTLFLGAGVSMGAGLPGWEALLSELAVEAGMGDAEIAGLARLHVLDRARIVEMHLERRAPAEGRHLGQAIAKAFAERIEVPMAHALLAALPVGEVVTTNYDELFERASRAIGKELAILPHAPIAGRGRWLLKMHGCVTDPDHIVLTREDYLRYDQRRQALAGIVQALLMTRHMLFIGFSLKDDNFHRIADAVRRARTPWRKPGDPTVDGDRFGTALELFSDPMAQALWGTDLGWVTMDPNAPPQGGGRAAWAASARRLAIFLDAVLAQSGTTEHLLDARYDGALSDAERALAGHLHRLALEIERDPTAKEAAAWAPVEALLRRLGRIVPGF
ncbi:Hypothetical protein A7982_03723 [Minicystis rosea]|nr:Hypothetical protein A7982_03723 [Minicystis rosea]